MNKFLAAICLPLVLCTAPLTSWAGDDHDDHHHHRHYKQKRHHHHERKEEFWDGRCKVERKWKNNGEYKEKRKCRDRPVVYHAPQPVYVQPQPMYVPQPQGLVINSQIHLR